MTPRFDNTQAFMEGWHITNHYKQRIVQALSRQPRERWSEADARVLQFVKDKAAEGSAYHIEALAITQLT